MTLDVIAVLGVRVMATIGPVRVRDRSVHFDHIAG